VEKTPTLVEKTTNLKGPLEIWRRSKVISENIAQDTTQDITEDIAQDRAQTEKPSSPSR